MIANNYFKYRLERDDMGILGPGSERVKENEGRGRVREGPARKTP